MIIEISIFMQYQRKRLRNFGTKRYSFLLGQNQIVLSKMDKLIELIKSKSFSAAEKLLRKELALSPNNCYLLTQLANVLWNRCKDEEALSYADKAKEVCPVMLLLNYTRGRILWSLEKYEQSIEEWDVVLNMTVEEVAENGYGVRWAKKLLRNTQKQIDQIQANLQ